ncbi:carbohydrate kinase family protein [Paenibacillus hamazuiensis]|uniref:carbohydrate kinase family protein n=1 Tax=Paenibacillus hamazuiensis TaxID=2936508 RepID=UPI0020108BAD
MKAPIAFVGTATWDQIALVDRLPQSDQRIKARDLLSCGGGPAANAAVSAQVLGAPCLLISCVGDDTTGKNIVDDLRRYSIGTQGIQIIHGGRSSNSLIQVESTGLRTITYFGGVLAKYDLQAFPEQLIEQCALVHADGNHPALTLKTFQLARQYGKLTSLDGGNIPEDVLNTMLEFVDVFITDVKSLPEALRDMSLDEACKELSKAGPRCVAITNGKHGCTMWTEEGIHTEPGIAVQVIDTTGAGDDFHGAFAFGLWKGLSYDACLKLSNIFAAISCEGLGGRGKLLSFDELEQKYLK